MSTKIYGGFEVHGHTLETLLPLLKQLRQRFQDVAAELTAAWVVRRAAALRDRAHFGLSGDHAAPVPMLYQGISWLGAAWAEMEQRQRDVQSTQRRDTAVDFSAEMVLIPLDGRLLGIAYIEHPRLRELWAEVAWKSDYAYWNNSDGPAEVCEQAWQRRREDWERALAFSSIPAQNGFTVQLLSVTGTCAPTDRSFLAQFVPSTVTRAKAVALDVYLKERPQLLHGSDEEERSLGALVRALGDIERSATFLAWKQEFERTLPGLDIGALDEKADANIIARALAQD